MSPGPTGRRTLGRVLATATVTVMVSMVAAPASAGGWWSYPQLEDETRVLGFGETTRVTSSVGLSDRQAGTTYYAYLVRGIDQDLLHEAMTQPEPQRWWTTPAETFRLGEVEFDGPAPQDVHATIEVPEVEPGLYALMLCDLGCHEPLGDLVPLEDVYVGDVTTARLLRDVQSTRELLPEQTDRLDGRLDRAFNRIGGIEDHLAVVDDRVADVLAVTERVEAAVAALEEPAAADEGQPQPAPPSATAGWFLAGIVSAVAWSRGRRDAGDDIDPGNGSEPDREAAQQDPDRSAPELVTLG